MKKIENIPSRQCAIQLVGPDEVVLNKDKAVYDVGPHQVLCKVEAVGLCFSDMKLLKQFSQHARKSEIVSGIESDILKEIPSYKPNENPTVPGHEVMCTIVAVGDKVKRHSIDQKVLVQTDYRWLKTAGSNAAFGYNFEGGLQQYVLLDERVFVSPEDESFLIPVDEKLSRSATALVEPWACVESSYVTRERNTVLAGGKLLIVADADRQIIGFEQVQPAKITAFCSDDSQEKKINELFTDVAFVNDVASLPDEAFDDIIYFGSDAEIIEILNDKLAAGAIINIVLGGAKISRDVSMSVGRLHYGMTRWIGTIGNDAGQSYSTIPQDGQVRDGDRILVTGAAGPMGQMHVIRLICSGKKDLKIVGTDFDEKRLEGLRKKAEPFASKFAIDLELINPQKQKVEGRFDYFAIMAPVPQLVADAIEKSSEAALINIFAGIPASVKHTLDLNRYIENRCFMFGTSGSRLSDMHIVLEKLAAGMLDTNCSVDAVCGMAGAVEGMSAVKNRAVDGKIIVYPQLKQLPLVNLEKLQQSYPNVAQKLENGLWTTQAEKELLKTAK